MGIRIGHIIFLENKFRFVSNLDNKHIHNAKFVQFFYYNKNIFNLRYKN